MLKAFHRWKCPDQLRGEKLSQNLRRKLFSLHITKLLSWTGSTAWRQRDRESWITYMPVLQGPSTREGALTGHVSGLNMMFQLTAGSSTPDLSSAWARMLLTQTSLDTTQQSDPQSDMAEIWGQKKIVKRTLCMYAFVKNTPLLGPLILFSQWLLFVFVKTLLHFFCLFRV